MKPSDHQIAIEWDVATWSRALEFWEAQMKDRDLNGSKGLELGSRHGGLSFFFAKRYGASMYCSDYGFPSDNARRLHQAHGLAGRISYHDVDAARMPFADNSFDFVVFKSVLGVVGRLDNYERQRLAIQEIHRVLKPGGTLFFAENAKGSWIHRWARRRFITWGESWRYVSLQEMHELLKPFASVELMSTGFLAAFVMNSMWFKRCFAYLDKYLSFIPTQWRYVLYGIAKKQ